MKRFVGFAWRTAAVVAVLAAGWFAYLYAEAGELRKLEMQSLGACRAVLGAPGAEDIEVLRAESLAFLSSDDRAVPEKDRSSGGIYSFDLRSPDAEPRLLTDGFEGDFHPHGISLLEGSRHSVLHVVNHTKAGGHSIEVFFWEAGRLRHHHTVTDPLLISPNDVAAADADRFYVTNDHGSRGGIGRAAEDYLRLKKGSIVYWDGSRMRTVAEGLAYANGIALSPLGDELFVALTTVGTVRKYQVLEDGDLELIEDVSLGTGVDNIEVDRHGYLWVAAHPHLFSFLRHAGDPSRRSPSEALWVDREEPPYPDTPRVRPVFLTEGEELSGASVVVPFGSRLLIGSVFEPHFLVCEREGAS